MIKDLLPIGSIVALHDAKKKLMICGIKQQGQDTPHREYDYLGVFYPEGSIGDEYKFLFNHTDIEKIIFRGFEDIERQTFIERLETYYQETEKLK